MLCSQRSQKNQILFNVFPEWKSGGGIFSSLTDAPWVSDVTPLSLDIQYYGNHSGGKYIAPLLYHYLDTNGVVSFENRALLVAVLKDMFYPNWERLWNTYNVTYNPLNNYSLTEQGTKSGESKDTGTVSDSDTINRSEVNSGTSKTTNTGTVKDVETLDTKTEDVLEETSKSTVDGTVKTTYGHVVNTDASNSSETIDRTFGFNSGDTGDLSGKSNTTGSNSSIETNSGSDQVDNDTVTDDEHNSKDTKTNTGTDTNERTLNTVDETEDGYTKTNTGNDTHLKTLNTKNEDSEQYQWSRIGTNNKSPAELIMAEREAWLESFFERVFEDVDRVLALNIYADRPITTFYF